MAPPKDDKNKKKPSLTERMGELGSLLASLALSASASSQETDSQEEEDEDEEYFETVSIPVCTVKKG
jgi:hypothetical protein